MRQHELNVIVDHPLKIIRIGLIQYKLAAKGSFSVNLCQLLRDFNSLGWQPIANTLQILMHHVTQRFHSDVEVVDGASVVRIK